MSESESSNDTVLHNNEIQLNLDYMISLKYFFENEYSTNIIDDSNELSIDDRMTIKKIVDFLQENNKTNGEIKEAVCLLYDSIFPGKKDNVLILLHQLFTPAQNALSGLFSIISNMEVNNTDTYTGDAINPSLFLNIFNHNLIPENNNSFSSIFNTMINESITGNFDDFNVPITFEWIHPMHEPSYVDVKNVATDTILNDNTKLLLFKELDDTNKNRYKTCSICIDDYELEDNIRQLSCSHIFHKDCIDPWLLKESYKCPLCRDDTLPHRQS